MTTHKRHQNFVNTEIADQLGTFSWSNDSFQIDVKILMETESSQLPQKQCNQGDTHLKICKYSSL